MLADARDIKSSQTEGERHTKLQKERDIQSSQIRRRKETYKARKHTKRERHTQLAKTHKERDIQSSQRHRPPRVRVYLLLCVWSVCCARTHLRVHVLVSVFCSQKHSRRDTHTAFRDTLKERHTHSFQRHRPTRTDVGLCVLLTKTQTYSARTRAEYSTRTRAHPSVACNTSE